MSSIAVRNRGEDSARPLCYHCREPYPSVDVDRHTEPVSCDVCPLCTMMPVCFTCRNMYCACEVHQR